MRWRARRTPERKEADNLAARVRAQNARKNWTPEEHAKALAYYSNWYAANGKSAWKRDRKKILARQNARRRTEEAKIQRNNQLRHRRIADPIFKIRDNLRRRINFLVHRGHKSARTVDLLGCTVDQFLGHLEINFQDGMGWENYGFGWHIDHKRPCASFDLSDPAQQRECFHWKNLQPLFAKDNLSKGARIINLPNKENK